MKKSYVVLPVGQYPFSKEYVAERATIIMDYDKAKECIEGLSKSYPNVKFIMFGSVLEMTYVPTIVDFGH